MERQTSNSLVREASFSDPKKNTLCRFSTSPGDFPMLWLISGNRQKATNDVRVVHLISK